MIYLVFIDHNKYGADAICNYLGRTIRQYSTEMT